MDNFSKLNGTVTITNTIGQVWGVKKKRKTSDKYRRNGRDNMQGKFKDELKEISSSPDKNSEIEPSIHETENPQDDISSRLKKNSGTKIDLTI